MTSAEPRRDRSAKQSPPTPVEPASTTHCTAHAVTAASIALPPSRSASMAASVAVACEVAAMPLLPTASDRPGSSKSRMAFDLSHVIRFNQARGLGQAASVSPELLRDDGDRAQRRQLHQFAFQYLRQRT